MAALGGVILCPILRVQQAGPATNSGRKSK